MQHYGYTVASMKNSRYEEIIKLLDSHRFSYNYDDAEHIIFDNQDITLLLKHPIIDHAASVLSSVGMVRDELNKLQRAIASNKPNIVIDGRDAGSVVFAHADYKFFLTAHEEERARRWQKQQAEKGHTISFENALQSLHERDQRDSQRTYAPLVVPKGAQVIDTTGMSINKVVDHMMSCIHA
jgi:cytidylate kinase